MYEQLSVEQFVEALNSDAGLAVPLSAEGLVRKTVNKSVIEFSPSESPCHTWIEIPVAMIDQVQPLGKRQCGDKNYESIRLRFKLPTSPEAMVFAELLRHFTIAERPESQFTPTARMRDSLTSFCRALGRVINAFSQVPNPSPALEQHIRELKEAHGLVCAGEHEGAHWHF